MAPSGIAVPAAPPRLDARPTQVLAVADLRHALVEGWHDFRAAPTQLAFLCVLYPIAALVFGRIATGGALFPLLYPLVSGFALVGPLAAVGLYEISRRREQGLAARWQDAFRVLREPGFSSVATLGVVLLVLFVVWLAAADLIERMTIGGHTIASPGDFLGLVFGTSGGLALILIGNLVGFLFAVVVLSISVFSIPLALDRATPPVDAIRVSLDAVRQNPLVMALWGVIVVAILAVGMIPAFIGLAVAMPVLGHATWHLYRRCVGS